MVVRILPSDSSTPVGKIADAEIVFDDGILNGLKLVGFSIWERRGGNGGRNVTFPARTYSVNGERRSFALLRPVMDTTAQEPLRALILQALAEYEAQLAAAEPTPANAATLMRRRPTRRRRCRQQCLWRHARRPPRSCEATDGSLS